MRSVYNTWTDIPAPLAMRFGWILGTEVDRPDHLGKCWTWPTIDERGYGKVSAYVSSRIVKARAHRISYLLLVEHSIQAGKVVRHLCGNYPCVRPHHLTLGTQVENMADAKQHGTIATKEICSVDRCSHLAKARGMCGAHIERVRTYGDPIAWLPIRETRGGRSLLS